MPRGVEYRSHVGASIAASPFFHTEERAAHEADLNQPSTAEQVRGARQRDHAEGPAFSTDIDKLLEALKTML